jgi:shikimate kinase
MATGKTSTAKEVARKLGKRYVSTDDLIVGKFKKTVAQIFYEEGEEVFRKKEVNTVKEVSKMKNVVIDCGGGIVINKVNIDRLKQNGIIFLLKAELDAILERSSKQQGKRPLLIVEDGTEEIKKMFNFREPLYENSADYIINTTELSVEEVAEKVTEIVRKSCGIGASESRKK